MSPTTIINWKKDISIKPIVRAPRKISTKALKQDITDYPNAYYYERAARLGCNKSGVEAAMKQLSYTQKSLKHPKSSWLKRLEYTIKLKHYQCQGYPIIYVDESGFKQEVIRAFGYTTVGKPCIDIDIYNYQKTKRTNVIAALYRKSLFALDTLTNNINWQVVYDWFKYNVIPKLGRKCVIVMDNARFHKNKSIKKLLNRHGHRIFWLPPYSPDLNPIEHKWAEVKKLRQGWGENNLNHLFSNVCCYNFKLD